MDLEVIIPGWPIPPQVRALTTNRRGGVSVPPYASLNLAQHVGDVPEAVAENRRRLLAACHLPQAPRWLEQVHGTDIVDAAAVSSSCRADASFARRPGVVCAVLTADCLPVLFCHREGTAVAVAHAGWRGLASGVLEATVRALDQPPEQLLSWLGPAIGPHAFEVGEEVRQVFLGRYRGCEEAFRPAPAGHWRADLYTLARYILAASGVGEVYGGDRCTFEEPEHFFSYRRDRTTGRMATIIWIED